MSAPVVLRLLLLMPLPPLLLLMLPVVSRLESWFLISRSLSLSRCLLVRVPVPFITLSPSLGRSFIPSLFPRLLRSSSLPRFSPSRSSLLLSVCACLSCRLSPSSLSLSLLRMESAIKMRLLSPSLVCPLPLQQLLHQATASQRLLCRDTLATSCLLFTPFLLRHSRLGDRRPPSSPAVVLCLALLLKAGSSGGQRQVCQRRPAGIC